MKLSGKTCYTHLLWLICSGELLEQAVYRISYTTPEFRYEGVAECIETSYEIDIKDLQLFSNIWYAWYSLTDKRRTELYGLAKGLGDCK